MYVCTFINVTGQCCSYKGQIVKNRASKGPWHQFPEHQRGHSGPVSHDTSCESCRFHCVRPSPPHPSQPLHGDEHQARPAQHQQHPEHDTVHSRVSGHGSLYSTLRQTVPTDITCVASTLNNSMAPPPSHHHYCPHRHRHLGGLTARVACHLPSLGPTISLIQSPHKH